MKIKSLIVLTVLFCCAIAAITHYSFKLNPGVAVPRSKIIKLIGTDWKD